MIYTLWHDVVGLALHLLSPVSIPSIFIAFYSATLCPSFISIFLFFAENEFVELGCFQDNGGDRAMGKLLKNLRQFIDWRDMSKIVKKCSEIARHHS